jgi:hypothetical protein
MQIPHLHWYDYVEFTTSCDDSNTTNNYNADFGDDSAPSNGVTIPGLAGNLFSFATWKVIPTRTTAVTTAVATAGIPLIRVIDILWTDPHRSQVSLRLESKVALATTTSTSILSPRPK